jgi:hypothetical protein
LCWRRRAGRWRCSRLVMPTARKGRRFIAAVPFYGLTPPGGGPPAPGYSQINGAKMKDAVRNAKVSAVGIAGREAITIRVPYGHPIRTEDSIAFKRLPLREITLIAKEVGIHLARTISAARPIATKRAMSKAPRLALSVTPRSTAARTPRRVG